MGLKKQIVSRMRFIDAFSGNLGYVAIMSGVHKDTRTSELLHGRMEYTEFQKNKIKEREEFASQFKESPWSIYLENIQYLIGIAFILFFSIFFADFS